MCLSVRINFNYEYEKPQMTLNYSGRLVVQDRVLSVSGNRCLLSLFSVVSRLKFMVLDRCNHVPSCRIGREMKAEEGIKMKQKAKST